jgi:hypothetical protein
MSPTRWVRPVVLSLLAAAALLSLTAPGSATVNFGSGIVTSAAPAPRYCSGAFRYAARTGNTDIVALPPAQIFANDRRLSRMLRRTRDDFVSGPSPLTARTAMCG